MLRPVRIAVVFSVLSVIGIGFALTPIADRFIVPFSSGLANTSGAAIRLFGGNARAEGAILRNPSNGYAIEMKNGCNGIDVTILLWAALLAFPASWSQQLKGMIAGAVAIQSLNLVRFISLFYLRQYSMSWFEFAHEYLWQSLIVLDTLVFFWVWVQFVARTSSNRHA